MIPDAGNEVINPADKHMSAGLFFNRVEIGEALRNGVGAAKWT